MNETLRIAGISGSLRSGSYNTAALNAAKRFMPEDVDFDIVTLEALPLFNEDVEAEGWPPEVRALRKRIESAQGVIFATPEYNYSIPGVLKNAIDWLSRPERKGPIYGKPAAIIGATPSMIGTARAQAHLRQVVFYNAMPLLPSVEVLIARASEKFDSDGALTDQKTEEYLRKMASAFIDLVRNHLKHRSKHNG